MGENPKAIKGWMFTILRREIARLYGRYRPEFVDVDLDSLPTLGEHAANETSVLELQQAMEKLPEKYRRALSLKVFDGHSCEEVGQIMGLSAGAVMTRVHRARKMLRDSLTGCDISDEHELPQNAEI